MMKPMKKAAAGLGLESLGDLDLSGLLSEPTAVGDPKKPYEISLDLIDEDPDQPRHADNPGFSPESIAEIGQTIKDRGVKSPISVRENPDVAGRYIINHGARRYRGSRWAGKETIPAFVDNDYNHADQVIENLQRNELTPREIADFIGRELASGKKKLDIAREIGKSPAFVTQHVTLLDLPEPIAEAFNNGRVRDVTVVNELVKAFQKNEDEVEAWLEDDSQELTRGSVKLLREFIDSKSSPTNLPSFTGSRDPHTVDAVSGVIDAEQTATNTAPIEPPVINREEKSSEPERNLDLNQEREKVHDPEKFKKAIVQVRHDDRPGRLLLNKRPPAHGFAWVKYDDDGHEFEADLSTVELVAVIEG
jgi:ParB family chromosome partitioning protein